MMIMTSEQQYNLAAASPDRMFLNDVCSDTVGLYVDTPPMPPMPEEKVELMKTPYANGDLYGRTGMYEDITITVRCFVFDGGYHPGRIYKFLSNAKTLYFTCATDYFYQVKKVLGVTPQYQTAGKNFLNVQFVCSPFRYRRQSITQVLTESPATCDNIGNVYSEPEYRLTLAASTDTTALTVNGTTLAIDQSVLAYGTELVVDVQRRIIYTEAGGVLTSVQSKTSGAFWRMVLIPGYNAISWAGGITSVEITPRTRWL